MLCAAPQIPANTSDFLWPHFTSAVEGLANFKIPYDFSQRHNFMSTIHSRSDDGPAELKRAETTFMFVSRFEFQTLACCASKHFIFDLKINKTQGTEGLQGLFIAFLKAVAFYLSFCPLRMPISMQDTLGKG